MGFRKRWQDNTIELCRLLSVFGGLKRRSVWFLRRPCLKMANSDGILVIESGDCGRSQPVVTGCVPARSGSFPALAAFPAFSLVALTVFRLQDLTS